MFSFLVWRGRKSIHGPSALQADAIPLSRGGDSHIDKAMTMVSDYASTLD